MADPKGQERNKYAHFNSPYMAAPIPTWAATLAAVDRSRPPVCGRYLCNFYVLPEPAMLVASEPCRNLYLHHYELIRNAFCIGWGMWRRWAKPWLRWNGATFCRGDLSFKARRGAWAYSAETVHLIYN
jgi:hypothetical protein